MWIKAIHWWRAFWWTVGDVFGLCPIKRIGKQHCSDNPESIPLVIINYYGDFIIAEVDRKTKTYKHRETKVPEKIIRQKVWDFMQDNSYTKQK